MTRHAARFRLDFPPELPISARVEDITAAIARHPVLILAGETGSGKTTQIPKMCLAAGRGTVGRIACTQPRRVAALSISRRVAEELGVPWGREVGCKIRFADHTSPATIIKYLTDGMLLAELQGDPGLGEYDTIIIDEAHERSLNIDFLLGHLRQLRIRRPELRIVITSATIDTQAFSRAFDDAPVIEVSGRLYPVEVIHAPLDELGSDAADGDEPGAKADLSTEALAEREVPGLAKAAKAEALHYIDGAVAAVERILRESPAGDILVFMPAERDIRETRDLIEGRRFARTEVIPLFGRLANAEQERVFAPTRQRKIVVATNIAETSLTIPGIRFVIDTGLARISRYAPQARTRRLPIEPIAQSSADQRKGRCGRVADGVCIRLYSEQDYRERPRFTQPEIQRCNLADVILRMKVFGLGDIERFPFINAPPAKAVRAGYALLQELGALEPAGGKEQQIGAKEAGAGSEGRLMLNPAPSSLLPVPAAAALTPVGRELARLPVDPTVGRMILQARIEKCLREVLVIAAGLSIQDPRERPLDRQAQADTAHRRFAHPDSDFLTLLNIWEALHGEFEVMTQGRLRRFCHEHFLSYTRLREWRDIHDQLIEVLEERDDFKLTSVWDGIVAGVACRELVEPADPGPASPRPATSRTQNPKLKTRNAELGFGTPAYRAIHRSILAGLLGNIAVRDEQTGLYRAAHSAGQQSKVSLFPGSVLHVKPDGKKRPSFAKASAVAEAKEDSATDGKRLPRWIMAAEIVETTRLFARTVARLDPAWALDLGAHLLRISHTDPFWNAEAGRVLVKRRARLYGLELESRAVGYGKIDPVRATEIFIREGLVNDTITWPFDFLAHNRKVRDKVEIILTRARSSGYLNLDEAMYRFYAARLLPEGRDGPPGRPSTDSARPALLASRAPPASGVSSVPELVDLVRERRRTEPAFLQLEPEDLRGADAAAHDAAAFPDTLPIENRVLPLDYAYRPGREEDGVTITVAARDAAALTPAALDWAVPGHLEEKVLHLLKALPTSQRRTLIPLAEAAKAAARAVAQRARLRGHQDSLAETLAGHLREAHRLAVDLRGWAEKPLPDHLRVRVQVVDEAGRPLAAGRDLTELHRLLEEHQRQLSVEAAQGSAGRPSVEWRQARAKWELGAQTTWTFGEIPDRIHVGDQAGVPVYAYPALVPVTAGVALRLMQSPEEAQAAQRRGLFHLFELQLRHELAWLQRDLRDLRAVGVLAAAFTPAGTLPEQALESLRRWTCGRRVAPLTAEAFARELDRVRTGLRGVVPRLTDRLREIFTLRQELLTHPQPYPGLAEDLAALLPPDFLAATPFDRLAHLPRYLKAMQLRAGRWKQNPERDAGRARQLAPYVQAAAARPRESAAAEAADRFRWLVEEFRVSLFAQELGTAEPVSPVKLDRELEALRHAGAPADAASRVGGKPAPVATPAAGSPLKSLGALDRLFPTR
ncbi:MAG: ATP-dependent RNA helicase HrpA [Opitutaceae bacterium]|nr:ATP-dependent RNA helicase HrpA [Opitutaceae bacterium]